MLRMRPPFRVLGNLVAFGVLCAFVYSMTLLPALLAILPLRAPRARAAAAGPGFFDRLGDFVVARRTYLLWFAGLLTAALLMGIPRIELTDNWTQYFDERYEFRRDTDFVIENLTGMEALEYSLSAGREGGITDPDYLHAVDAFAAWFRSQPEVTHVQAFPDIMKRLNRNMHGDDPAFHRLPDDPALAAQYLLLYELSLPFGNDLNNRIDVAKSATRLTATMRSLTSRQQRDLDARAQAWLHANSPRIATEASGVSIVFAHLSQRNIESMLRGTIIAMALISLILIGVFRSVRLGLVSLVPNFIPAAMSFGLWGYLVGHVGLAGSVMVAIAFGIIVDDTIHFLNKYLTARREGLPSTDAVRSAFRSVGHALWTTTTVLSLGFLVFATSGFEVSWGAWPDGHAHHRLRPARRLPAPPAPADGHRPEELVTPELAPSGSRRARAAIAEGVRTRPRCPGERSSGPPGRRGQAGRPWRRVLLRPLFRGQQLARQSEGDVLFDSVDIGHGDVERLAEPVEQGLNQLFRGRRAGRDTHRPRTGQPGGIQAPGVGNQVALGSGLLADLPAAGWSSSCSRRRSPE